jgi:DNA-cytosine methyltransferase
MSSNQFLSLFSGIGGSAFGARAAGYELIGAVEFDEKIGDYYYQNHKSLVLFQDVKDVDPTVFKREKDKRLTVQLSPPCTEYSSANCKSDLTSSRALVLDNCYHILDYLKPDRIIIENVRAYKKSQPMDRFRGWLSTNGYTYIEQIVNCADFGVPQSRTRYFLMATKESEDLNYLQPTHAKTSEQSNLMPWKGWHEAIEDLIPDMAITKLSDKQYLALREWDLRHPLLIEARTYSTVGYAVQNRFAFRHKPDPSITILAGENGIPKLLIPTLGYYSDLPPIYSQYRLAPTVKAMMMSDGDSERKGCWRLVDNCEVREMSVKGLARLQTFPDNLILPNHKGLACKMIGNAVPPIIMEVILKNCFSGLHES